MTIIHAVSMSAGKDSTATAILALEEHPNESLRFAACDTGNEGDGWRDYLAYLEKALGISITILRASFDREIAGKRAYVLSHWASKGVPTWVVDRAAAILVPTGNPFLDLCLWKGRFPSRRAQFCTQHLKTLPLVEYQMGFIDRGEADAVWAWQGVRLDESESRRSRLHISGHMVRSFEETGGGIFNYRPILRWSAADAFEAHRIAGVAPNPLYMQGMSRVGCMPCVNSNKDELLQISKRFPEVIERIAEWEALVGIAAKGGVAGFFPDPDRDVHLNKRGIRNMVEWSKTQRGGRLMDFIRINEEPKACESAYGLCE